MKLRCTTKIAYTLDMTRTISENLTKTSAAYLRDAIGAINHDSFDRYQPESSLGLQAMQIAFDWQANDNESRITMILKDSKKRAAHFNLQNEKFRTEVNTIAERVFDNKQSWPEPTEWTKHFSQYPTSHGVPPAMMPSDKDMKPGSFEYCMAWSDFNIQRIAQHRLTLAICSSLIMDAHNFKHLETPLVRARAWVWSQTASFEATRMQLIMLEGDPAKIQAVREEMLDDIRRENYSTDHFYGHFNGQSGRSTETDTRFRSEALRHVQLGFESHSFNPAAGSIVYSDLGLG